MSFNPPIPIDYTITVKAGESVTDIIYDGVTLLSSDQKTTIENNPYSIHVVHVTPLRYKSSPFTTIAKISSFETFSFVGLDKRFEEFKRSVTVSLDKNENLKENSIYTEKIPSLIGNTSIFEALESMLVLFVVSFNGYTIPRRFRNFIHKTLGGNDLSEHSNGNYVLVDYIYKNFELDKDFDHIHEVETREEFIFTNFVPFIKIDEDRKNSNSEVSSITFEYIATRIRVHDVPQKIDRSSDKILAKDMVSENIRIREDHFQEHEYIYGTIPFVKENVRPKQDTNSYFFIVTSSQSHKHVVSSKAFRLRDGIQKVATAKDHRHSFTLTNDNISDLIDGTAVTITTSSSKTANIPSHTHQLTIKNILDTDSESNLNAHEHPNEEVHGGH